MKSQKYLSNAVNLFLLLSFSCAVSVVAGNPADSLSIKGEWMFKLDPDGVGVSEEWYNQKLPDRILLPGSTDEQGYGKKNTGPIVFNPALGDYNRLVREYEYVGPAWYQKQIEIPSNWSGKQITVFLERCHWETSLWIDGQFAGTQNSLSVPHVYDISQWAETGKHTLTICVDNTIKLNINHHIGKWQWTHAITDETQTNWNGIIGNLRLNATDPLYIKSMKIYPQVHRQRIKVLTIIDNKTGKTADAELIYKINESEDVNESVIQLKRDAVFPPGISEYISYVPFPDEPHLWDEFTPFLYELKVSLSGVVDGISVANKKEDTFGMRTLGIKGDKFTMNGRNIFLRGNVDCCIYPLTGYPPTSTERWREIIGTIKNYGMNGIRFHSWCPPEAAFKIADELGMILQVEAPLWDGNGDIASLPGRARFIGQEVNRIIDEYGNHPSFCLLSMGNELGEGNEPFLQELVAASQERDPRHLYTCSTAPYSDDRNDDFYVAGDTPNGRAYGFYPPDGSMPTTDNDNHQALEGINRPFVVHEMGWPAMYPDFREISKYTGNLKPYNFIEYRKSLEEHHLLSEAENFRLATGAFTVLAYKYLIEQSFRTDNLAGFELLDLQDFPGQGVALVGILDAFLDSKQLITPEKWREFNSATVPLLRTKKWIWHNNEILSGQVELYHYGSDDLHNANLVWKVSRVDGRQLGKGTFGPMDIVAGGSTRIGQLQCPLKDITEAQKLIVTVSVEGTVFRNSWPVWVYPVSADMEVPENITITTVWNDKIKSVLAKGGKVLFLPPKGMLSNAIDSRFYQVSWDYLLFPPQPRTMGIICNPQHPALADFPTEFHTNWQWYDLLQGYSDFPKEKFPGWNIYDWMKGYSDAIVLNDAPKELKPIVSFIDDANYNYRLGAIFELAVGSGKLLVSSLDIRESLNDRPAARQMRKSLYNYMDSRQFNPVVKMTPEQLDKLFLPSFNPDFIEIPSRVNHAVLNIIAGARNAANEDWHADADSVVTIAPGFEYRVEAKLGTGWWKQFWKNEHVGIGIDCPEDFSGDLYVHYEDGDRQERACNIVIDGKESGQLLRYDGNGIWLKFPVSNKRADKGKIVLDSYVTSGPDVCITQIILMPDMGKTRQ